MSEKQTNEFCTQELRGICKEIKNLLPLANINNVFVVSAIDDKNGFFIVDQLKQTLQDGSIISLNQWVPITVDGIEYKARRVQCRSDRCLYDTKCSSSNISQTTQIGCAQYESFP